MRTEVTAQTYHLFINAEPEAVWDALTRPEHSVHYLFGAQVETTGRAGDPFLYHSPDRSQLGAGWMRVLSALKTHLEVGR